MAGPLIALLPTAASALKIVFSRWQGILAFTGFFVATTFSINAFISQITDSALRLWPILAIACFFLLMKEFIRGWVIIKSKETKTKRSQ